MASPKFPLDRRELMAGLGAAALAPMWPAAGRAQARPALALQAKADSIALRPEAPATPIWSLQGPELRFKRGETLDIAFGNELAGTCRPQLARDRWRPGGRTADDRATPA